MFHIRQIREGAALWEGMQILYVKVPWEIDRTYACWPRELAGWLLPFFGYSASVETVCDVTVERWLKEKEVQESWEDVWPYPVYREYHQKEYAGHLLAKAMRQLTERQVHFLVLGYEPFLPEVMTPYVRMMKTLTFVVEGEVQKHLSDYLEELCNEEGLAADLRVLEDKTEYRRLRLERPGPSVVLDLAGEERIAPVSASKGVFWIDMDSQDKKKHKILVKFSETAYFSMKEEWGRLDTASKNGYNT